MESQCIEIATIDGALVRPSHLEVSAGRNLLDGWRVSTRVPSTVIHTAVAVVMLHVMLLLLLLWRICELEVSMAGRTLGRELRRRQVERSRAVRTLDVSDRERLGMVGLVMGRMMRLMMSNGRVDLHDWCAGLAARLETALIAREVRRDVHERRMSGWTLLSDDRWSDDGDRRGVIDRCGRVIRLRRCNVDRLRGLLRHWGVIGGGSLLDRGRDMLLLRWRRIHDSGTSRRAAIVRWRR
jgi:hypothetical protein